MIQAIASDRTAEWYEARNTGVGASESAAVCGLSPYETAFDVWARKTGRTSSKVSTPEMELGTFLEPAILDRISVDHPIARRSPGMFRHTEVECVLASPDGQLADGRGLEIKVTTDNNNEIADDPDGLPASWLCQAQQQMAVCDFPSVLFGVVILPSAVREWLLEAIGAVETARVVAEGLKNGSVQMRYWTIDRHAVFIDRIIDRDVEFWNYVKTDRPPEINWNHSRACQGVRKAFENSKSRELINLSEDHLAIWEEYRRCCSVETEAKKKKDKLHSELFAVIGDSFGGTLPNGEVIRKVEVAGGPVSYQRESYSYLRAAAKGKK